MRGKPYMKDSHRSRRSHRVALWVVNLTEFLRKGSHRFNGFNRNVYSVDSCNSWLVILMQISHKFELCENNYFQWMAVRKRRYATAAMMATIV